MKNLPSIDPQSYQPLREQVYDLLREAILTGKLEPGEQITEVGIAEQLKVSRTPAREALRMLELEGFVIITPRRGAFVGGISSEEEIDDIFQVRRVLEGLASSLAAENISQEQVQELKRLSDQIAGCIKNEDIKGCIEIDTSFHQIIYKASENECLQKFLDNLFEQITRFRAASLSSEGRMDEALIEHQKLAKAIGNRESDLARQLAERHIENAWERVVNVFKHQQHHGG